MVEVVTSRQMVQYHRGVLVMTLGVGLGGVVFAALAQFLPGIGVALPLVLSPIPAWGVHALLALVSVVLWGVSNALSNGQIEALEQRSQAVEAVLVPSARYARLQRAGILRVVALDLIPVLAFVDTLLTGSALACQLAVLFFLFLLVAGHPRLSDWEAVCAHKVVLR